MRNLLGFGTSNRAALCRGLILLTSGLASGAGAQTLKQPPTPPDATQAKMPADVVVTGEREPDVAPIAVLDAADIGTYGADSVGDLVAALAPLTRSATGNEPPIVLINGKQVSGPAEIATLPPEALRRMEIYPEEKALRLGFPPNRRVVNFLVLKKFRSLKANLVVGTATRGGGGSREASLFYSRIDGERRVGLGLSYKGADALFESQRAVEPPTRPPYTSAGTLIDTSGTLVGTADGPDVDLASTRTLRGATETLGFNGNLAGDMGGSALSLTTTLSASWNHSFQGPAVAALAIPASNPFSTLGEDVTLYRYLGEARPLRQASRTVAASLGLAADGALGKWHWNAIARYDRNQSHSIVERGVDVRPLQAAILAGDPSIDPFGPLPIGTRIADHGNSISDIVTANAMLNGPVAKLPAGDIFAMVNLSGIANRADATSVQADTVFRTERAQDTETGIFRLLLPLTSRRADFLPWAGSLIANITASATRISHYGVLKSIGYGGNWSPSSTVQFSLAINDEEGAPPIDQLVSPTVRIPNVPVFDYRTGTSILVTAIAGGNPDLAENRKHSLTAGVALTPFADNSLRISASYVESTLHDPVYTLPAATPAIEQAFPERFVRNADGTLLSIDSRPLNIDRADRSEWNTTLSFSWPPGTATATATNFMGLTSARKGDKANIVVDLSQVWRLRDDVRLRPGLPKLDLLAGNAIVASGGQPRHELILNVRASRAGIGLGLEGQWKSGTRVVGDDPAGDLSFSDLATLNARLFADLGNLPGLDDQAWAKSMRVTLDVTNLFDGHIDVRDGTGAVPIPYQPGYLNPLGLAATMSLRKLI